MSPLVNQKVFGLQVTVHYFVGMHMPKTFNYFCSIEHAELRIQFAHFVDKGAKSTILAMLEHEVKVIVIHKRHSQEDNKWLSNQQLEDFFFTHYSLALLFLYEVLLVELLDCHIVTCCFFFSQIDLTEGPLSNLFVEIEIIYGGAGRLLA